MVDDSVVRRLHLAGWGFDVILMAKSRCNVGQWSGRMGGMR